jgi:hypothetical protein
MSAPQDPRNSGGDSDDDVSFFSRWSRRKAEARREPAPVVPAPAVAPAAPVTPAIIEAAAPASAHAAAPTPSSNEPPAPVALPDIGTLDEDSDYSAFLTPGVDAGLRRLALRKLFNSPKFNVFDGLDTYRDDYTSFPALGDIVTADMRHHVERLAAKAAELTDEPASGATPGPTAAAEVATVAETGPGTDDEATPATAAVTPVAGATSPMHSPRAVAGTAITPGNTAADAHVAPHAHDDELSSTS